MVTVWVDEVVEVVEVTLPVSMLSTVAGAALEETTTIVVGLAHTAARPYTVAAGAEQACVTVAQ